MTIVGLIPEFILDGVKYQARRFTGMGPIDLDILQWITYKTGHGALDLRRMGMVSRPGLVHYGNANSPYVACSSKPIPKKIKPGKWIVISTDGLTVELLKNEAYEKKYAAPAVKQLDETINTYQARDTNNALSPIQAVKVTRDSISQFIKLFNTEDRVIYYRVDHEIPGDIQIYFRDTEPGVEIEWNVPFGRWLGMRDGQFIVFEDKLFRDTYYVQQ